jgi:chromosome segregation ATPase
MLKAKKALTITSFDVDELEAQILALRLQHSKVAAIFQNIRALFCGRSSLLTVPTSFAMLEPSLLEARAGIDALSLELGSAKDHSTVLQKKLDGALKEHSELSSQLVLADVAQRQLQQECVVLQAQYAKIQEEYMRQAEAVDVLSGLVAQAKADADAVPVDVAAGAEQGIAALRQTIALLGRRREAALGTHAMVAREHSNADLCAMVAAQRKQEAEFYVAQQRQKLSAILSELAATNARVAALQPQPASLATPLMSVVSGSTESVPAPSPAGLP